MKNSSSPVARLGMVALLVLTSLLVVVPSVSANVRLPGGNVPFYARIGRGEIYHTDDWAAIIFYRPPGCVPPGFNLLDFFDVHAVSDCTPPTTTGFDIWTNGPSDTEPAPKLSELHGLGAVPIWFVNWPALQAAIADDVLTIGELRSLGPREEYASFYQETLRPTPAPKITTGEINATGKFEDGGSFQLHIQAVGVGLEVCSIKCTVRIVFN